MPAVKRRITCAICLETFDHGNEHHVQPQAYGGRDGATVDLCATHHDMIHATADRVVAAKRGGRASPPPWSNGKHWQRALPYIRFIVQSKMAAIETGSHINKVTLEFSPEDYAALKELKIRMGTSSLVKAVRKSLNLTYRTLTGKQRFN